MNIIPDDLFSRIESSSLPLDNIGISVLSLSNRSYNRLTRNGIDTLHKLVYLTDSDIASMDGIGAMSFQEIVRKTNSYLERTTKPQEFDRLFKTTLYRLLQAQNISVDYVIPTSLASSNKLFLNPIPLRDIVVNNDLLNTLLSLGFSSSLDIWILALGHYLKIAPIFTDSLEQISNDIAGNWQIKEEIDYTADIEAIYIPNAIEKVSRLFKLTPYKRYSNSYVRVKLSIKASPNTTVHWEALLPFQCLTQKINWVHYDDKTKEFCGFLIQSTDNNVKHWADPPTNNWNGLTRTRADHAFVNWLFSIRSNSFERNYEIFKDWFGLTSGERKTLEEVGSKYNITRERVRQVVNRFIKLLLHPSKKEYLVPFVSHFDMLFRRYGGIMTLREIVNSCKFFDDFTGLSTLHAAELLLTGCNKYEAIDYHSIKNRLNNMELGWTTWYLNEIDPKEIKRTRDTATRLVTAAPFKYHSDDLITVVSSITGINKEVVRASLRTYKRLQDSRLGYTPSMNGDRPLTTSQMVIIALRELIVPAHYSVIYKKLRDIFPGQNIDIRTLRNTLNSGQFKTIDRGIYGLLESDY